MRYATRIALLIAVVMSLGLLSNCITLPRRPRPPFTWRVAMPPDLLQHIQKGPIAGVQTGGGYECDKTHPVQLRVRGNSSQVTVHPFRVTVEGGKDCVEWVVVKEDPSDTSTVSIELIDMLDTAAEAKGPGKEKNEDEFGDQCQQAGPTCLVAVPSKKPHTIRYRYIAKVIHGFTKKESDPEVEVLCTGCGEP